MNCYKCGNRIPLHRLWRDRTYCSVEHRSTYKEELKVLGLAKMTRLAFGAPAEAAPSLVRTSRPILSLLIGLTVALPLVAATVAYAPGAGVFGSAARWQS